MEGPVCWQMVVRNAYDISGVRAFVDKVKESCVNYLVTQHDKDENTNTTHCHILVESPSVSAQTYRNWMNKAGYKGQGNSVMYSNHDVNGLGRYMMKGKLSTLATTSFGDEIIARWVSEWQEPKPRQAKVKTDTDPKKLSGVKTQWEIMSEILAETRAAPGVWEKLSEITTGDDGLIPEAVWICKNHRFVWNIMLKHLAINKIRTSTHELERWYVTMMRESRETSDAIFRKISEKLY